MSNGTFKTKMITEEFKKSSKLTDIIPELYFDIISRIIPGSIIIAILYFLKNPDVSSIAWQHVLIGSILAYYIGSILDYFCSTILRWPSVWIGWRVIDKNAKCEDLTKLSELCGFKLDKEDNKPSYKRKKNVLETLRFNFHLNSLPNKGGTQKQIAEERLVKNTFCGLIFGTIIIAICKLNLVSTYLPIYWRELILAAIILSVATFDRIKRSVTRTFFLWRNIENQIEWDHGINKLERLNGKELGNLIKKVEKVKDGKIEIAGPVLKLKDYEKYQLKNYPNTVDIAVTVVMGAPFEKDFCRSLRNGIKVLESVFEHYEVRLNSYNDYHLHATVYPMIRTKFEIDINPCKRNVNQRQEIRDKALNPEQIEEKICGTQPFYIEFRSWNIKINDRGEILLWGSAKDDEGKKELEKLRKRLRQIAGPQGMDSGFKVHITLATIQDFHKLTILQKKEIACKINDKFDDIDVPGSVFIDQVSLVQYLHRSLSRMESSKIICFLANHAV
jgi:hypothetical protein